MLGDRAEELAIHGVQSAVVDLEQSSASVGERPRHAFGSPAPDLGVVAHPLQQPVRDARRPARATCDERGRIGLEGDVEDVGRAAQDMLELGSL